MLRNKQLPQADDPPQANPAQINQQLEKSLAKQLLEMEGFKKNTYNPSIYTPSNDEIDKVVESKFATASSSTDKRVHQWSVYFFARSAETPRSTETRSAETSILPFLIELEANLITVKTKQLEQAEEHRPKAIDAKSSEAPTLSTEPSQTNSSHRSDKVTLNLNCAPYFPRQSQNTAASGASGPPVRATTANAPEEIFTCFSSSSVEECVNWFIEMLQTIVGERYHWYASNQLSRIKPGDTDFTDVISEDPELKDQLNRFLSSKQALDRRSILLQHFAEIIARPASKYYRMRDTGKRTTKLIYHLHVGIHILTEILLLTPSESIQQDIGESFELLQSKKKTKNNSKFDTEEFTSIFAIFRDSCLRRLPDYRPGTVTSVDTETVSSVDKESEKKMVLLRNSLHTILDSLYDPKTCKESAEKELADKFFSTLMRNKKKFHPSLEISTKLQEFLAEALLKQEPGNTILLENFAQIITTLALEFYKKVQQEVRTTKSTYTFFVGTFILEKIFENTLQNDIPMVSAKIAKSFEDLPTRCAANRVKLEKCAGVVELFKTECLILCTKKLEESLASGDCAQTSAPFSRFFGECSREMIATDSAPSGLPKEVVDPASVATEEPKQPPYTT